jgi:hypothetical protein
MFEECQGTSWLDTIDAIVTKTCRWIVTLKKNTAQLEGVIPKIQQIMLN